ARSLRKHLEFPCSWMYPPHRTGEVMPLAVFCDNVALVKDAVPSVEPDVRPPGQRTGQFMEIGPSNSGQNHFPAHFLPIPLAQKKQVGRVKHPNPAMAYCHPGRNVEPFGENADL